MSKERAREAIESLLRQIEIADSYAAQEKPKDDRLPSVWEIQNGHLRDRAREALAAISE